MFSIGWYSGSYGYHGDDGKKFKGYVIDKIYGPLFTTGDTVGVGINNFNNTIFFTNNGIHLGKKVFLIYHLIFTLLCFIISKFVAKT